MYSIISKDRRITKYVKAQCYKWLFTRVANNEYEAHSSESENVILQIKKAGEVTEYSYGEFCKYFLNDPYYYMLNHERGEKLRGITSTRLANYFVKYNNEVLPAGFIREFFEDDYETQQEIEEFFKTYLDGALDEFIINCQMTKNRRYEDVERIKQQNRCVFEMKLSFHITNAIKFILTVFGLVLSLVYLIGNNVVVNFIDHVKNGGNEFMEENLAFVVANVVFLFYLLPHIKKAVRLVLFYISVIKMNVYINSLVSSIDDFSSETIESFKNHFNAINERIKRPQTLDQDCYSEPEGRKDYLTIIDFDASVINEKLQKIANKYGRTGYIYVDENTLARQKREWRKGVAFFIFVTIAFVIIDIPAANEWFFGLVNSIIDKIDAI